MALNKIIISTLLLIVYMSAFAEEPKFPNIGLLFISGLSCDEDSSIEEVPNQSTQYFLSKDSFYKIIVIDNSPNSTKLPYPEESWLQVINNLPEMPEGCSTAIAIQDSTFSSAKFAMKRFNINSGNIYKANEIYFWGE